MTTQFNGTTNDDNDRTTTNDGVRYSPEPRVGYVFRHEEGLEADDSFIGYCVELPSGVYVVETHDTVRTITDDDLGVSVWDSESEAMDAITSAFPRADVWTAWDI